MIGKQVGNYKIIGLIGKGGMAVVYRGQHLTLSRRIVAIKMLSTTLEHDPSFNERFFREADVMDRLKHPNIVTLYDFIEQDHHYFIVMEYVDGVALSKMIKDANSPMPIAMVRDVFRQVLDAIGYAHRLGIVHRDLKPSNIMLNQDGQVKITDFGIARLLAENIDVTLTTTGMGIGSPYYMSPEQVLATKDHPITAASDIYSLGITLYQMVTGELPFTKKDSLFTILQAHISTPPPPPHEIYPDISESLETVILKAIEKEPKDRWATCEEFWNALDNSTRDVEAGKIRPGTGNGAAADTTCGSGTDAPATVCSQEVSAHKKPETDSKESFTATGHGGRPGKNRIWTGLALIVAAAGAGTYLHIQHGKSTEVRKELPPHTVTVESNTRGNAQNAVHANRSQSEQQQAKQRQRIDSEIKLKLVKAEAYLDAKNYLKAKQLAQKILQLDPNNKKVKAILADAADGEKRKFIDEKLTKGYTYLEAKAYELAIEQADQVLKTYKGESNALELKEKATKLLEKKRQNELARKKARIARYMREGKRFFKLGKYEQSIMAFREVLRTDPDDKEAKAWLARAKKALDAVRKAWATGGGAYKIERQAPLSPKEE